VLVGKSVGSAVNGFSQVILQLISDVTPTLLHWTIRNCDGAGSDR